MSTRSWTPRKATALCERRLDALARRVEATLSAIALEWTDENSVIEFEAERVAEFVVARLKELRSEIREQMESLEQERAARG